MIIRAVREHEFCAGHRVVGHEGKCKQLHGHGYVVSFVCEANQLDSVGRVIDFSVIKYRLCEWLETNWDHRTLLWEKDPWLQDVSFGHTTKEPTGIVSVPFNPTAENIAGYLLREVGPKQLEGTGVKLVKVVVNETRKCSATAELGPYEVTSPPGWS